MQLNASAPGSLMLLGEYGVLYGKPALVCAVDKRINVTLMPRADDQIILQSTLHGSYKTTLSTLSVEKPFQFVLSVLKEFVNQMTYGCDIDITTQFSDKMGLGSSAAVTVATLAALTRWLDIDMTPLELVRVGRHVVRQVQGVGSGADIAACVYGGMIGYHPQPLEIEKLAVTHPLTALYAGYKTPTADAISHVQTQFSAYPDLFSQLCNSIGLCAAEGIALVRNADWAKLGAVMNMQQGLMESLGVNTPLLRDMVDELRKQTDVLGAKISGSGLGDCVVALGGLPEHFSYTGSHAGIQRIPVTMTLQGVECEKI